MNSAVNNLPILNDLRYYLYIDNFAIKSIFSQMHEFDVTETNIKKISNKTTNIKSNIHSKLKLFFADAAFFVEPEKKTKNTNEIFTKQERSIEQIISYNEIKLLENGKLKICNSINELLNLNTNEIPCYVAGVFNFYLNFDYYIDNNFDLSISSIFFGKSNSFKKLTKAIKREGAFVFTSKNENNQIIDGVFNKVAMSCSISKFVRVIYNDNDDLEVRGSSAFSFRLRCAPETAFELGVMGSVTIINNNLYIKPYAIWDPND